MTNNRNNNDDLTEADLIVEGLYERSKQPIPCDESDEAVLAFAREAMFEKGGENADTGEAPDVWSGVGTVEPTEDNRSWKTPTFLATSISGKR